MNELWKNAKEINDKWRYVMWCDISRMHESVTKETRLWLLAVTEEQEHACRSGEWHPRLPLGFGKCPKIVCGDSYTAVSRHQLSMGELISHGLFFNHSAVSHFNKILTVCSVFVHEPPFWRYLYLGQCISVYPLLYCMLLLFLQRPRIHLTSFLRCITFSV